MRHHNKENSPDSLNKKFSGRGGHSGVVGFVHNYSNFFSIFYCFDIPIGTYNYLIQDPVLLVILKYHIQIKMLFTAKMALDLTRKQRA
jgi:hypothetical protein